MKIKRMRLWHYFQLNNIKDDPLTSKEKTDVMFVSTNDFSMATRVYNRVNLILSLVSLKLATKKMVVFLMDVDGKIEGFSYLLLSEPFAELGIFINKEKRDKGFGTVFMRYMVEWAHAHGYTVRLSVLESNKRAIAVYKKLGMNIYDKRLYMRVE